LDLIRQVTPPPRPIFVIPAQQPGVLQRFAPSFCDAHTSHAGGSRRGDDAATDQLHLSDAGLSTLLTKEIAAMTNLPNPLEHRAADHPIEELFLRRWSPRAMTGEAVSEDDLNRLFEAARWAPSTYNEQEWRFLYATNGSDEWPMFLDLLAEGNQPWCTNAGALIVGLSCKTFSRNGKPNPVHTLDCGLATENLLLQGAAMGLVCHGMAGFDRSKARVALEVPDDFDVEVMIAVGYPGKIEDLPKDYQEMDRNPTGRKPLDEIRRRGKFAF
jgi:nitroreductase